MNKNNYEFSLLQVLLRPLETLWPFAGVCDGKAHKPSAASPELTNRKYYQRLVYYFLTSTDKLISLNSLKNRPSLFS